MVLVHSVPTCRASKVTAETGSGPFYVCTVMLQIRKKQKMLDSERRPYVGYSLYPKLQKVYSLI